MTSERISAIKASQDKHDEKARVVLDLAVPLRDEVLRVIGEFAAEAMESGLENGAKSVVYLNK